MDISGLIFDEEPHTRDYYDQMTDAEVEIAVDKGIIERLADGTLKITPLGLAKFNKMAPSLIKAQAFCKAAGVTNIREMADIAYLFHIGNTDELARRYAAVSLPVRAVRRRAGGPAALGRGRRVGGDQLTRGLFAIAWLVFLVLSFAERDVAVSLRYDFAAIICAVAFVVIGRLGRAR